MRNETRAERYSKKMDKAVRMPISLVAINFMFDDNLAFLIRAAACYGAANIYVIGSIPPRSVLQPKSGSLVDFYDIETFKTPHDFLQFAAEKRMNVISAELMEGALNLHEYSFDFCTDTAIVLGNEMTGVPVEILMNSQPIYIPMPGFGFCLNTSQTGTAFLHEASRQFLIK